MKTVRELCEATVGYVEGPNNETSFGKWYGLQNQPWCAMSASKMYFDAGRILEVAPKSKPKGFASCDEWLKYLTKNGQLVPIGEAKTGDLVFYQMDDDAMPDHVEIVESNRPKRSFLNAWGGNTSDSNKGSQSNGGGFYLKKRPYSLVMAVARPKRVSTGGGGGKPMVAL
jgi:hypothetical protein